MSSVAAAVAATAAEAPEKVQDEKAFDPLDLNMPIKFRYPQNPAGKLDECIRIKEIANARFKAKMFWPAIRTYATALAYVKGLDGGNPLNQQMAQLLGNQAQNKLAAAEEALDADGEVDLKSEIKAQNIFLNTNIAFAYCKVKKFDKAVEFCDKALALDPGYPKALLRKAEAFIGLNKTDEARAIVETVQREAPDFMGRKTLATMLKKIAAQDKKNREKMRKKFGGMFGKKKQQQKSKGQERQAETSSSTTGS